MNYKIIADSSANLQDGTFVSVPLKIITGDREFVDDASLDIPQMATYLSGYKRKTSTACPGVQDYLAAFGNAELVFCYTITSNLSGSYNAARLAKIDYEAQHPGRKVIVVDTLSAGPEIRMQMEQLARWLDAGEDPLTLEGKISDYGAHTGLMFSLESLQNLANNGRVSPLVAKLAGVLGIRVVGRASNHGTLEPQDKCPGEKKALSKVFLRMREQGYQGGRVRIDHCLNEAAAKALRERILEQYPTAQVTIGQTGGLCTFYAEIGGLMIGFEKQ